MINTRYTLQGMMYLLGLHLFLGKHLPRYDYETHMGGMYYLFLRGLRPEKETGIYSLRPPHSWIEQLRKTVLDVP